MVKNRSSMMRSFSILYGSLFLIIIVGCTSLNSDEELELDESFFESADQVEFSTVRKSAFANNVFKEKESIVFRDEESFEEFWIKLFGNEFNTQPEVPEIDFTEYTVLASIMGVQRSGGFLLTITEIAETNGVTGVKIEEIEPGPNCFVTAAITQPFHIVKFPKSADGDIRFLTQRETIDCDE